MRCSVRPEAGFAAVSAVGASWGVLPIDRTSDCDSIGSSRPGEQRGVDPGAASQFAVELVCNAAEYMLTTVDGRAFLKHALGSEHNEACKEHFH